MKLLKKIEKNFKSLLPIILASILLTSLIIYITDHGGSKLINQDMITTVPIFLTINFLLLLFLSVINLNYIIKELKKIKSRTLILLFSIVLLAFCLRMYVVPHTHRILFDEDLYLSMGRTMVLEGRGCLCNHGNAAGKCFDCFNYKDPKGYPFLLAVVFLLFGISETVAFNFVVVLTTVSVVLTFLISRYLFNNDSIALFSSLLLTLSPVHIIWSGTVAAEPVLLFFVFLSVWVSFIFARKPKMKTFLLLVAVLAFSLQIKTEGILILPLVAFIIIVFSGENFIKKIDKFKFFLPPLLLFFFIAGPFMINFYHFATTNDWEAPNGRKISLEYGPINIPSNFSFLIMGEKGIEQPLFYIIFAIIGIIFSIKNYRKSFSFLGLWLLSFFMLYGFFFAGSAGWGSNERYSLTYYTPLIFFGGVGMKWLNSTFGKMMKRYSKDRKSRGESSLKSLFSTIFIITITIVSFLFCIPNIATPTEKIEEGIQSRTYHDFVIRNLDVVGTGCYVFSHVPSIFLMFSKNSAQPWLLDNVQSKCKIFDYGYWCNVDPFRGPDSICKQILRGHNATILARMGIQDHSYTLYSILK